MKAGELDFPVRPAPPGAQTRTRCPRRTGPGAPAGSPWRWRGQDGDQRDGQHQTQSDSAFHVPVSSFPSGWLYLTVPLGREDVADVESLWNRSVRHKIRRPRKGPPCVMPRLSAPGPGPGRPVPPPGRAEVLFFRCPYGTPGCPAGPPAGQTGRPGPWGPAGRRPRG